MQAAGQACVLIDTAPSRTLCYQANYVRVRYHPRTVTMKSVAMAVACVAGAQAFVAPRSVVVLFGGHLFDGVVFLHV